MFLIAFVSVQREKIRKKLITLSMTLQLFQSISGKRLPFIIIFLNVNVFYQKNERKNKSKNNHIITTCRN